MNHVINEKLLITISCTVHQNNTHCTNAFWVTISFPSYSYDCDTFKKITAPCLHHVICKSLPSDYVCCINELINTDGIGFARGMAEKKENHSKGNRNHDFQRIMRRTTTNVCAFKVVAR